MSETGRSIQLEEDWDHTTTETLVSYSIHGLILQGVMIFVSFTLEFILLQITISSNLLLLLLATILVSVGILGGVNEFLSRRLWAVRATRTIKSLLGQGVLLLVMLLSYFPVFFLVSMWLFALELLFGLAFYGILLIALSPLYGYVGKHVAYEFEAATERREELASVSDRHRRCPKCGQYFNTRYATLSAEGWHHCPHCQSPAYASESGPQLES